MFAFQSMGRSYFIQQRFIVKEMIQEPLNLMSGLCQISDLTDMNPCNISQISAKAYMCLSLMIFQLLAFP